LTRGACTSKERRRRSPSSLPRSRGRSHGHAAEKRAARRAEQPYRRRAGTQGSSRDSMSALSFATCRANFFTHRPAPDRSVQESRFRDLEGARSTPGLPCSVLVTRRSPPTASFPPLRPKVEHFGLVGRQSSGVMTPDLPCRSCESLEVLAVGLIRGRLASARRCRSPGAAATAVDARVAAAADGSRHTGDADLPMFLAVAQSRARRQWRLRDGRAEWCGSYDRRVSTEARPAALAASVRRLAQEPDVDPAGVPEASGAPICRHRRLDRPTRRCR
jgi:hypothetical protein